ELRGGGALRASRGEERGARAGREFAGGVLVAEDDRSRRAQEIALGGTGRGALRDEARARLGERLLGLLRMSLGELGDAGVQDGLRALLAETGAREHALRVAGELTGVGGHAELQVELRELE